MGSTEDPVKEKTNNPVENKADHPVKDKADNLVEDTAVQPVKDNADHPVEDKADHLVKDKTDHPVEDKADHPVKDKADHPVKDKADQAVEDKVDQPVQDKADQPGQDKADHPVEDKDHHVSKADNPAEGKDHPVSKADNPAEEKDHPVSKADHPAEEKDHPVSKADHLPDDAKSLLKSLASDLDDLQDMDALRVIPLKGAFTNKVFQIKWPTKTGETTRKVIVRIYGEGVDNFFERNDEIQTFELMSQKEQGPRLLGRFANGRIEEFIKARTLSAPDLRDPSISVLIAAKMKEFHDLDMPGPKKVKLWDRLRKWISIAKGLSSPEEVEAYYLDTIDKEIDILEKELAYAQQSIGFCHNDLQYGNIMLNEETKSVTLIDYEYSSYNPVAYDIANHFCEMAADYHGEKPHILNFSKYPDFEERKKFVHAYLSTSDQQPGDSEVEQLLQEVEKFTLANHLFWGVWGVISAHVNKIDFDYKEYAKQRIKEYWSRKPYLLCSAGPSLENIVTDGVGASDASSSGFQTPLEHTPSMKSKTQIFKRLKKIFGLSLFRSKN